SGAAGGYAYEPVQELKAAPAPPPPASVPIPQLAPPAAQSVPERIAVNAEAPAAASAPASRTSGYLDLTKAAEAADMSYAPPKTLFGVALGGNVQQNAAPLTPP